MDVAATSVRLPVSPSIVLVTPTNGSRVLRFPSSNFGISSSSSSKRSSSSSRRRRSRSFLIKATSSSFSSDNNKIAPLELQSPIGQFLSQILINHPHLLTAAVDQQLQHLQSEDDDNDDDDDEAHQQNTDLVLYRRIAEVKANEKRNALEEILYTLVVHKFMEANVSLIPSITSSPQDSWSNQDTSKLEQLHSQEAYEMIQNHLALILGNRAGGGDLTSSIAQISKLRVGQVYAASLMYGYFLKRVDQRFQLEKSIKILPNQTIVDQLETTSHPELSSTWPGGHVSPTGFGYGIKPTRLRNYVMSFDGDTLQRYATIRSKEAVSIIEKHTEALFGRPEIVITPEGGIDYSKDENIKITFDGLKRLVLEAVTFGCFLWDVESYVDSRYHFVLN